jgi:hypothetical protein
VATRVLFLDPGERRGGFWVFDFHLFGLGFGFHVEVAVQTHGNWRLSEYCIITESTIVFYYEAHLFEKNPLPSQRPQLVSLPLFREQELGAIQSTQLTADNIIDKLLRPNLADKKQTIDQKYRPKFEKRDYETLSKENMGLKVQLKAEKQSATQLKFKLSEIERKARFLEGIQEKWEQSVQEDHDGKRL